MVGGVKTFRNYKFSPTTAKKFEATIHAYLTAFFNNIQPWSSKPKKQVYYWDQRPHLCVVIGGF